MFYTIRISILDIAFLYIVVLALRHLSYNVPGLNACNATSSVILSSDILRISILRALSCFTPYATTDVNLMALINNVSTLKKNQSCMALHAISVFDQV